MARYRTRRRRRGRGRKKNYRRRTYAHKKNYRGRQRMGRKMLKNKSKYIHAKAIQRSYNSMFMRPIRAFNYTKSFQNSTVYSITIDNIVTGIGHYAFDCPLACFLSLADLNFIKAYYRYWTLNNIHITCKIISYRNMTKYITLPAAPVGSYATKTEGKNFIDLYWGFFRNSDSQSAAAAIDPDAATAAANRESLLETGYYRRIEVTGKPVTSHWYQPTAFTNLPSDTSASTSLSTTLANAFSTSLAVRDQPHGFDLLWCDRDRYGNPTTAAEKASIKFQLFATANITLSQPLFSNF